MSYISVTDFKSTAQLIARAFQPNAFNYYTTAQETLEQNALDFEARLHQLQNDGGAHIVSDPTHTSIAVWIPPTHKIPNFPESALIPPFREAEDMYAELKKKYLGTKPHWHLTILAKDPSKPAVTGATSSLVRPFLEFAKSDGVPAMLECIDAHAKEVYEHYGFAVVEEFVIGVGKCDSNGNPKEGGDGVKAWYMLYNNE